MAKGTPEAYNFHYR